MIAHHSCGASWVQDGNQAGHCCTCHRNFHSERAFDAHRTPDGPDKCVDPATLLKKDGSPRWETFTDRVGCEVWRSTEKMSDAARARLKARDAARAAAKAREPA